MGFSKENYGAKGFSISPKKVKFWGWMFEKRSFVQVYPAVILGPPWLILGHPCVILDHPRVILGHPGVVLGHPGVVLGHPGVLLGNLGFILGYPVGA